MFLQMRDSFNEYMDTLNGWRCINTRQKEEKDNHLLPWP